MSINFPFKSGVGELNGLQKHGLWKVYVYLSLFALLVILVFFFRYLVRFRPSYSEVGMYHPPDYRPSSKLEEKPAIVVYSGAQHLVRKTSATSVPSSNKIPVRAPLAAKASTVEMAPAAMRKPEGKPVQNEVSKPSSASEKPQVKAKQQSAPVTAGGAYTLLIGEFSGSQTATNLRTKLQQLGITQVHEEQVKKIDTMHRLFLANYENRQAADSELQKLRQWSASAFMVNDKGNYVVYAGSYLQEKRAVAEQQRLAGENIKLSIQTEPLTITLTRVTAGSFAGSTPAQKKADLLEKQGIHVQVIKAGMSETRGVSPPGS